MGQVREKHVYPGERMPPNIAKLICKLRWIGMNDEARRLQMAAGKFA